MKIGVNTRLLLHNKLEGIGWYAYHILKHLVQNHPEHTFYFFFDRKYHTEFIFAENVKPIIVGPQARHPLLYGVWFDVQLPRLFKKHKIDVFYSPEGLCPLRSKIPALITIHDLAYLHFPQGIDATHLLFYKNYQQKFAKKAKHIFTVSEYTKQDILNQYGIEPNKITVTYNAAHADYKPLSYEQKQNVRELYTDDRQYFLFVGALHPRKNIINILKAFVKFKRRQKCGFKLVIVGRMAWMTKEIEEAKNRMPFKEDVVWLGYQNIDELTKIVGAAYGLVFPSFFEGFGIPIIEAMACNVPAIVSETSSMPEVAGSAALTVNPNSVEDIAEKIGILYKDESLRKKLSENCMLEINRFDWEVSAEKVWQQILKVADAK